MSSIQSKNHNTCEETRNYNHSEKKMFSTENDPKMIPMLELTDKDFKAAIINALKD